IVLLRNVRLTEASFQVSHLLKYERAVRQTPERFFVRLERALEVAQNTVAINALRKPCFSELGLERHRPIRGLFHSSATIRLQIHAIEIELAARDSEARPCQRELRIKPDRLGIQAGDVFCDVESSGVVERDPAQVSIIRRSILGWLLSE